ncbi:MAG: hypothetical protein Q8P34_04910 [Bacteroidota bacterium]|nr:hypothetical protein [Bacteroidota bacterium]
MKKQIVVVFMFLVSLCCTINLDAQEKKNSITVSGIIAHFINNEKYQLNGPEPGYYESKIDPGLEILVLRSLTKNTKIGTGFNIQKVRVASYMSGLRRFDFYELSIPVIFQTGFTVGEKNRCFFTTGIYGGKTILQKYASPNSSGTWRDYKDFSQLENYSDDVYFIDAYFDTGYSRSFANLGDISLAPFVKYRLNSTWLNYHQDKVHYGIKLMYSFKI